MASRKEKPFNEKTRHLLLPVDLDVKVTEYKHEYGSVSPDGTTHLRELRTGVLHLSKENGSYNNHSRLFGKQIVNWKTNSEYPGTDSEPISFNFELKSEPIHDEFTGDDHPLIPPYWYGYVHLLSIRKINEFGRNYSELILKIQGSHCIGVIQLHDEEGEGMLCFVIRNYWETVPYTVLFPA